MPFLCRALVPGEGWEPSYSAGVRRMRRSKIVLVLLALTLIVGFASGFTLLYRFSYVLVLATAIAFLWSWLNLRSLEATAERKTTRTQVGQWAEERLWIRNRGLLPKSWLEVMDKTDLPGHHTATVITLPGKGFRSWLVRTQCLRRGRFTLGPLSVVSGDTFGLFRLERTWGATHNLLVYPRTVDLPRLFLPPNDLPGDSTLQKRTQHITPNASSVRDYVYGDSFNRIHWLTTVRTGRLMVKEFDAEPSSEIWLILDLDEKVHAGAEDESTEEYGVTIAASIAKRYLDANFSLGLVAYGQERIVIQAERGPAQINRVMDALALIKAKGTVPLEQVLVTESNRFGRHTTVVIITPSSRQEWLLGLRHLTQRKARLAIVLLEGASFGGVDGSAPILDHLASSDLSTFLVRQGEDISKALTSAEGRAPTSGADGKNRLLSRGYQK